MTNESKQELLLKFRTDLESAVKRFKELKLMTQVSTTDDETLSIDADTVGLGTSVYTLDDNGNNTPAEDGEYTLTDGMIITVTDGKISNIAGDTSSTQDETTSPDAEMKEEMADTATAPTDATAPAETEPKDDTDLANRVGQLEQQMGEVITALQQVMEVVNHSHSQQEQLMSKVDAISKEPASPAIKNKPVGFSADKSINADMASFRRRQQLMIEKGIIK